ncbi:MAG: amino acid ABC transporter substrate-binding protein, partial [Deltaproteobacteria bacterium]|nr:amino acid ABC transporter substrate-binding protein [Deltaproteobacteria bacterium]
MMYPLRLTILAVFLLCFSLRAEGEDPVRLKIGATLPLTGRLAEAGEDIRRGLELAAEDLSRSRFPVTLVYEDNRHEGRAAAAAAQKLITEHQVDVLISLWDIADVVAPIAERAGIPHLSIRADRSVSETYTLTMTFESTIQSYAREIVRLVQLKGAKSISVITENARGWLLINEAIQREAASFAIEFRGEEILAGEDSAPASSIARIVSHRPDYVIVLANRPLIETLVTKLLSQFPNQSFTGYFEALPSPRIVEGKPFVAFFEAADWFHRKFRARYGADFVIRAPQAYDLLQLLALAQATE